MPFPGSFDDVFEAGLFGLPFEELFGESGIGDKGRGFSAHGGLYFDGDGEAGVVHDLVDGLLDGVALAGS